VVEGSGFENRRTGNGTRGSNPFSSAEIIAEIDEAPDACIFSVTKSATKTAVRGTPVSGFEPFVGGSGLVAATKAEYSEGSLQISRRACCRRREHGL
jgi:hypothetical protein